MPVVIGGDEGTVVGLVTRGGGMGDVVVVEVKEEEEVESNQHGDGCVHQRDGSGAY